MYFKTEEFACIIISNIGKFSKSILYRKSRHKWIFCLLFLLFCYFKNNEKIQVHVQGWQLLKMIFFRVYKRKKANVLPLFNIYINNTMNLIEVTIGFNKKNLNLRLLYRIIFLNLHSDSCTMQYNYEMWSDNKNIKI